VLLSRGRLRKGGRVVLGTSIGREVTEVLNRYRIHPDTLASWFRLINLNDKPSIGKTERRIMAILAVAPTLSNRQISRIIGISESSVAYHMKKLRNKYGLCVMSHFNPCLAGLENILVILRMPRDRESRRFLGNVNSKFLMLAMRGSPDSEKYQGYLLMYAVPRNIGTKRFMKEFCDVIGSYKGEVYAFTIKGVFTGINFALPYISTWKVPRNCRNYDASELTHFLSGDIFWYSDNGHIRDKIDLLLFLLKSYDFKMRSSQLVTLMHRILGKRLCDAAVRRRVRKLSAMNAWRPFICFRRLGLDSCVVLNLIGDFETVASIIMSASCCFPQYFAYIHEKGAVLLINVSRALLGEISKRIMSFVEGCDDHHFLVSYDNALPLLRLEVIDMWSNEERGWQVASILRNT